MTADKIDTLKSKIDVVSEFLHKQEVPYLLVVGIPGTEDYDVRDNISLGEDQFREAENIRYVANHILDQRRTYETQES